MGSDNCSCPAAKSMYNKILKNISDDIKLALEIMSKSIWNDFAHFKVNAYIKHTKIFKRISKIKHGYCTS